LCEKTDFSLKGQEKEKQMFLIGKSVTNQLFSFFLALFSFLLQFSENVKKPMKSFFTPKKN